MYIVRSVNIMSIHNALRIVRLVGTSAQFMFILLLFTLLITWELAVCI